MQERCEVMLDEKVPCQSGVSWFGINEEAGAGVQDFGDVRRRDHRYGYASGERTGRDMKPNKEARKTCDNFDIS